MIFLDLLLNRKDPKKELKKRRYWFPFFENPQILSWIFFFFEFVICFQKKNSKKKRFNLFERVLENHTKVVFWEPYAVKAACTVREGKVEWLSQVENSLLCWKYSNKTEKDKTWPIFSLSTFIPAYPGGYRGFESSLIRSCGHGGIGRHTRFRPWGWKVIQVRVLSPVVLFIHDSKYWIKN